LSRIKAAWGQQADSMAPTDLIPDNGPVEPHDQGRYATIKTHHYDDLQAHVRAFVTAQNFTKYLKALRWRTPYQFICEAWTKDPSIFKINPRHLIPGPHI
jgi:hypothetical protein